MYTVQPFGERALLVTLPSDLSPTSIAKALVSELGVTARVGIDTIMLTGASLPSEDAITKVIQAAPKHLDNSSAKQISIPVVYDGEDLREVAEALAMTVEEVIAAHQQTIWHVALVGFAPGFPYLVPADTSSPFSQVKRLTTPRSAVPAGSVAVAAGMSAVYPSVMPGGWMLLGRTEITLFEPESTQPSLLTAGDIVKFVEVQA
jgi:KipI family sensor histidine kinase inhibitor